MAAKLIVRLAAILPDLTRAAKLLQRHVVGGCSKKAGSSKAPQRVSKPQDISRGTGVVQGVIDECKTSEIYVQADDSSGREKMTVHKWTIWLRLCSASALRQVQEMQGDRNVGPQMQISAMCLHLQGLPSGGLRQRLVGES